MSYPDKLKVSGLPFFLHGWNNTYYKTKATSEGCPVYRLDPYVLYWLIPIVGVRLLKYKG
jgi:hypothetical protein